MSRRWRPLALTEATNGETRLPEHDWKMSREERRERNGGGQENERGEERGGEQWRRSRRRADIDLLPERLIEQ